MHEIQALARQIASSDAEDPAEQGAILASLHRLRDRVEDGVPDGREVSLRLDSCILLARYLSQMGSFGGEEVLRIVGRLVSSLEQYFAPDGPLPVSAAKEAIEEAEAVVEAFSEEHGLEHPAALPPLPADAFASDPATEPVTNGAEAPAAADPEADDRMRLIDEMLLGEILVQFGTINSVQVCQALELQKEEGLRFGEALVRLGAASKSDVLSAVSHQDAMRREAAGEMAPTPAAPLPSFRPVRRDLKLVTDMLLGDVLVRMGAITPQELEAALQVQRATGMRIGEALVHNGSADWRTIKRALSVQSDRRTVLR